MGYADNGESVSARLEHADVNKVLCSVHKMKFGGSVIASDSERSYVQNRRQVKGRGPSTRKGSASCTCGCRLAKEETEIVLKRNRFAILAAESEQVFGRRE